MIFIKKEEIIDKQTSDDRYTMFTIFTESAGAKINLCALQTQQQTACKEWATQASVTRPGDGKRI